MVMKKQKAKGKTDFLLPINNFWVGLGSVINIAGNYFDYNFPSSHVEVDRRALASDWMNVGKDFKAARKVFEKENFNKLFLK